MIITTDTTLKILRVPTEDETSPDFEEFDELNFNANNTYDKILAIHLNEEEAESSLLVLQASNFSIIQMITY